MNQTKKRLSIINLAISITDLETIQLQTLKLALLKTDAKIQKILSVLQAENYAQAQALITTYIDSPTEEILQRTSQKVSTFISSSDQAIIDEFDLFVTSTSTHSHQQAVEIDINKYASERPKFSRTKHEIDFDTLLNLNPEDVLSDNIDIDISNTSKTDTFFDLPEEKEETIEIPTAQIPKDTFFDANTTSEEIKKPTTQLEEKPTINTSKEVRKIEEEPQVQIENTSSDSDIKEIEVSQEKTPSSYPAMTHISQKLIRMKKQYPPIQKSYEKFDTVESFLTKISQEGYTEGEIEEMLVYIKKLIKKEKYTEASNLLLICGSTESKFAQFSLARELFTGSVLTKNVTEAFTLMNTLAIDDYPEALCDMGQFHEHGIGTKKDTMKAESLYKEALSLGINRAEKHYTRLKKQNRKFFN
jgi:hypothetical protein